MQDELRNLILQQNHNVKQTVNQMENLTLSVYTYAKMVVPPSVHSNIHQHTKIHPSGHFAFYTATNLATWKKRATACFLHCLLH